MTEPVVHLVSKGNRASRLRRELHKAIGVIVDEHGEDLGVTPWSHGTCEAKR